MSMSHHAHAHHAGWSAVVLASLSLGVVATGAVDNNTALLFFDSGRLASWSGLQLSVGTAHLLSGQCHCTCIWSRVKRIILGCAPFPRAQVSQN